MRWILYMSPLACIFVVLNLVFTRLVATEAGLEYYNFLNIRKFKISYRELTAYSMEKDTWRLFVGDRRFDLPEITISDLHALIADRAPHALKVRQLSRGLLPSEEPLTLRAFDGQYWFARVLTGAIFWIPVTLITPSASWPCFPILFWRPILQMCDLFGTLHLDSDGVSVSWPGRTSQIAWKDISTVFCEGEGADSLPCSYGRRGCSRIAQGFFAGFQGPPKAVLQLSA